MKRARPAEYSRELPAKKRIKAMPTQVTRKLVIPGVTRTGGAYERALLSRFGGEGKYVDYTVSTGSNAARAKNTGVIPTYTALTGGLTTLHMCKVVQGTSANQRIGNKIRPYQIRFRGDISYNSALPTYYRVLLVQDNQANGSLPDFLTMFTMNTSSQAINAFYNMDNIARFKFLKDKTFRCPSQAVIAEDASAVGRVITFPFKMNHKLKGNPVMEYSGVTGDIAEVRSTNYFIVFISSAASGDAIGSCPQIDGHMRFYFKE